MYNSQEIAERIKRGAKRKGVSIKTVLHDCELGVNTVSKLSKGTDMLSKNLAKIADYLDCSVDFLLGRVELPDAIYTSDANARNGTTDYIMTSSKTETTLLTEFRDLNTQGQEYILQTMDMVKDKYKKPDSVSHVEDIG